MKNTLLRINDVLYRICIAIAGLSVLTMSLIIPWGIFARYVLGSGSSWPEPTAISASRMRQARGVSSHRPR